MIALFLSPPPYVSGGLCPRPTIPLLLEGYTLPQSLAVTGIVSVKYFSLNKDFSLLLWLPKGHFLWNWKEHSFKEVGKVMYFLLTIVKATCFLLMVAIFSPKHQISHISSYLKTANIPYYLWNSSLFTYLLPLILRKNSILWSYLTSLSLFSMVTVCTFFLYSQISLFPPPGNRERTKVN